ncbi:MAG: ATP-binding cassette domain-containing protein [Candidatus Delongbacteria bacterium]|nr:ATP-binding cassette domain-containing protein [Candidatus Delongbacteria bacterium]
MIKIEHLVQKYGDLRAVDDVSLDIANGEIVGLLGPNGAGKTTAMKVLTCFLPPTEGEVSVDDLDVEQDSLAVRERIGYLPENNPLYSDMTVRETLDFVADVRRLNGSNRGRRLRYTVEACGLEGMLNRPVGELSKGYRQRVGLAQAILHDPPVLVLDEPTSGLDPNQIVEIRNLIRELGKEKTVILSTHIMQEVQATCSRVVIIHQGKIVADGTNEELQAQLEGQDRYSIEFRAPGDNIATEFKSSLGIDIYDDVSTPGAGSYHYILQIEKDRDERERIFRLMVDHGWTLLELQREQVSLEDVFRELTTKS